MSIGFILGVLFLDIIIYNDLYVKSDGLEDLSHALKVFGFYNGNSVKSTKIHRRLSGIHQR